ncbi:SDR family oxidoreductase [Companilactobacillus alimentarius]|uniref:NAD(P)-dependent oxidoreductase n=1 Tax=Companilactobacillus alimentarius DSM 20249 TaxID=1423720 RepID=A0A2K9HM61_9LACO|nr:NAD(P)H-binding protein [Companilactobacillus alimentarius]AUI72195.1 NAD(P)-dependent oxidoreductase [Companilactobacillus alimentarius DSM 20249]KRK76333.1 hypothetical protein FC67_GL000713 [Companilactobacillus alimentarius DSM 20249]MDT6952738.1 NAD(P)H-binding protein [Companilactobacillus alimentarius]MDT6952763.1 NAD(P)H-binding protein [Companilactobacillus alimentarius]GEO45951.1 NAD(P)-dependent oxidoreductase [Companilactobacillus alimentarius]
MTTYAITGVTGHFGQNALKELAKLVPATDIVALARNTKKAQQIVPDGVEVRSGDYTDVIQLSKSLQGVDRLLFVSSQPGGPIPRLTQHQNVIAAAKEAKVGYIAYTSFPHADLAKAGLASDHKATEKLILESGMKYSFLRNNWYLENEAATLKAAASGKDFVYAAGEGKAGWALEKEYSEAAAKVLAAKETKNIYEFSGKARTYQDLAEAIDGDFKVVSLTDSEFRQGLADSGMDGDTIEVVASIQTLIRQGDLAKTSSDLPDVLGRSLTSISEAIKMVIGK